MRHSFNRAGFAALVLLVSGLVPALAQTPQSTVNAYYGKYATYSADVTFTPAASATDIFAIPAVAAKTIHLRRISCIGTSTAAGSNVVQLLKRSTLDTAGTAVTPTPVIHNPIRTAALAAPVAYTANPTLGTSAGALRAGLLNTGPLTAAGGTALTWEFGVNMDETPQLAPDSTTLFALNANGVSFTAGTSLNCHVMWTEQ